MKYFFYKIIPLSLAQLIFLFAQDRPSIDWKEIVTENYKIIFPKEIAEEGQRVANLMEKNHLRLQISSDDYHLKTPIVLRNRLSIPNAFVSLSPRKSEWYHTPIMIKGMGSTEWYNDLSIHEGRHISQFNFVNQGTGSLIYKLFGESTFSMFNNLLIPSWYWEGDAVDVETALSNSGRGRVPYFDILTRSLILSGSKPSYRQVLFGSYKNKYPDHYEMGYMLTRHIKSQYNANSINEILTKTLKWPFLLNPLAPFSRSVYKSLNSKISDIYSDALYDKRALWEKLVIEIEEDSVTNISPNQENWTDYKFPSPSINGSLIALKSGVATLPTIVRVKDGIEEKIHELSSSIEIFGFHSNGSQVVWSYYSPDKRWSKESWANIQILDLSTNQIKDISTKKMYYHPSLSKNGNYIVASSFSKERNSFLTIIDARTGKVNDRALPPDNGIIMEPSWSDDAKEIVFILQNDQGRSMYIYNRLKRTFLKIKDSSWEDIFRPVFYNNYVLFESPYKGIDNILAINLEDSQEYLLTNRKLGAYYPALKDSTTLLFSNYTSSGEQIVSKKINTDKWKPISKVRFDPVRFYQPPYHELNLNDNYEEQPDKKYNVENYSHFSNFLNMHSRYIFNDMFDPSLGIQSDNILGTASLSADISYNQEEDVYKKRIGLSYLKYYPIVNFDLSLGDRRVNYKDTYSEYIPSINDSINFKVSEKWNELRFDFNLRLPLFDRYRGPKRSFSYLQFGSEYLSRRKSRYNFTFPEGVPSGIQVNSEQSIPDKDGGILPVYSEFFYSNLKEKPLMDLENQGLQYYLFRGSSPFGGLSNGSQSYLYIKYLLKSFIERHQISIIMEAEHNYKDPIFSSKMNYPIGYQWKYYKKGYRSQLKYHVPLLYPDYSLPLDISYIKRVSVFSFLEAANIDNQNKFAIGGGITVDVGGFFDFKLSIPLTLIFFQNIDSSNNGIKLRFN